MKTNDTAAGRGSDTAITIAMLTYRRSHLLARAVRSIAEACTDHSHSEILIVDNDPDGSADAVVNKLRDESIGLPVRYVHEPRPGISAARNRALDEAHGDVLVFIDDDEVPTPGWLDKLMTTYDADRPTAVTGPVRHEFEVVPDPWIISGDFFLRRRKPTGTYVGEAASNNLLLDLSEVRALGTRFDDRLGLTGGEDSLFTKQLVKSGGSIIWCDDAEVVDLVPRSRINRRWVIHRAFRLANTKTRIDLMMTHSAWSNLLTRGRYLVHGAVRVGAGCLRILLGAATGSRRHVARGVRTATRGAGMTSGAFGYVYVEYARVTESTTSSSLSGAAPAQPDVADGTR